MPATADKPTKARPGRPAGPVQLLTPQEVADRLKVPLKTVYYWTSKPCGLDGKPMLAAKRLGRRVRIPEAALDALETRLQHPLHDAAALSFFSDLASTGNAGGEK